jgi:hypothetical protein
MLLNRKKITAEELRKLASRSESELFEEKILLILNQMKIEAMKGNFFYFYQGDRVLEVMSELKILGYRCKRVQNGLEIRW